MQKIVAHDFRYDPHSIVDTKPEDVNSDMVKSSSIYRAQTGPSGSWQGGSFSLIK